MREIRFRAWDKINREMIPWNRLLNGHNLRNVFMRPEMCGLILMQYTGLKDKNGVEIYEGDILILCWSDEVGESHWGKVIVKNPFEYTPEEARYFIYSDEIEVIGNIYENQELLGEEK